MTTPIIDFKARQEQRDDERERTEIRRIGFSSPNPTIQSMAFTIANEDWAGLEALLTDDDTKD